MSPGNVIGLNIVGRMYKCTQCPGRMCYHCTTFFDFKEGENATPFQCIYYDHAPDWIEVDEDG